MFVIPAINEKEFLEVQKKLQIVSRFSNWVHLDVADGKFVFHKTWGEPEDIKNSKFNLNFEIHLMTENPEKSIKNWAAAGAKRIIIHQEAINFWEPKFQNVEMGLAVNPETPIENLSSELKKIKFVLILAVNPGLSNQKFQPQVLEKVKFLKKNFSDVVVEVDGGINPQTALLAKKAGADIIVSSSFIWNSSEPQIAFEKLGRS